MLYHLGERHIDAELVAYCAKHDIAVVGYSPFGHGRFPSPSSARGRVLAAVAARHGATPRQVALAFLAREPPLFTIPKASTPAHAEENAGALQPRAHRRRPRRDRRRLPVQRRQRATRYLGHELVLGSRHRPPTQFAGARQCTVSLHCMPSPAGFGQTPSVFRGISEMP